MERNLIKRENSFYWPISIKKIKKIGEDFNNNLFDQINKFDDENKKNLIITIFGHLHNELFTLITHLIVFKCKKKITHQNYFFSEKSRIARSLINNEIPPQPFVAKLLEKGFKESLTKSILRNFRSLIFKKYPKSTSLKLVNLDSDIITIHTGDLIEMHREIKNVKIIYVPTTEWFKKLKNENNYFLSNKSVLFLHDFLVDQIFNLFRKYKISSTKIIELYIQQLVLNFLKNSNSYIGYILEKKLAPKNLWTTSGGSLFTRIIRLSSKISGGKVIGHDHSHGQGPFKNFINSFIEINFLDEFYVRTQKQKLNLEKELSISKLKNKNIKIKILSRQNDKILLTKPKNKKLVMLISSLYNVDASFLEPLPFAPVMLDWEIRTLNYLKSIGYLPIYKSHPESKFKFDSFFKNLDFEVVSGRFEQVYSRADILLFGVPNATSFFLSLKTNRSIVLVDLATKQWDFDALGSLKKRVGYVKTHHNRNNRIILDWSVLKRELKKSQKLKSKEFARNYFYPYLR